MSATLDQENTKVNGIVAEHGCYIEGSWGQYGLDRIADVAEQFGIRFTEEEDPRRWRRMFEIKLAEGPVPDNDTTFDSLVHAADRLEEKLNDQTENGLWLWQDGEFFLADPKEIQEEYE